MVGPLRQRLAWRARVDAAARRRSREAAALARPRAQASRGRRNAAGHIRRHAGVSTVDAYIGLGSNLAHPRRRLAHALRALSRVPKLRVVAVSRNYMSAPVGSATPQPDYVNAVARVRTSLPPRALLAALQRIERRQRRRREHERARNLPR